MNVYFIGSTAKRRYLTGGVKSLVPTRTQAMLIMRCLLRLPTAKIVLEQCLYQSRQFRQQHSLRDRWSFSCD